MSFILGFSYFIFGTIIGSFLNVVALRYNSGVSIRGRSRCLSCGITLSWKELIPVISFLFLRGRCLHCGSKMSIQYPLVEGLTGFLFLGIFLKGYAVLFTMYAFILVSILIVILIYDFHHKIVPNGLVYSFLLLTLAQLFINFDTFSFIIPSYLSLLAGPILFVPFFAIWFLSKGTWMGLGDGKLALGIGWQLGLLHGISAIVFAFWIGALVSIVLLFLPKVLQAFQLSLPSKVFTMKSEIPFAPFLIAGFFLVFFVGLSIDSLIIL